MEGYLLAVGVIALIYMLMTLGLNLHYGFTGLINFGHVGFFAVGAYTSAILAVHGVWLPLAFLAAVVLAALSAWPLGVLSLRLRIEYLAIVTLGFSEAVRLFIVNERWLTNGVQGIPGIPSLSEGLGLPMSATTATFILLVLANLAAILVIHRIVKSPFGRAIEAIRDDEEALRALGKDPGSFKIRVFMLGAAFAGLGGAFYAHYITFVTPDQFLPLLTFYIWVAMILGGAGRVSGAAVGTLALVGFLEGSRFLRDIVPGVAEVEMASLRLGVVGLALILLVIYRPGGIMGDYSS
ncbi:branched-chain amino acid ABC transporter permease [Kaustia mangrovi]|uniref:Branched-chain amino acid ABC transporter permease n=1 Tax=Kaustia mangrovi TaxID=2593653 RepID=A0A7S8HD35_9HYPH|nr:branched-chain amino acid ABC transporter permease [Kaustia mangrovi]QPC44220.1 branched-chain amino acid ABC transporter permease [Kaustia mangrovi]